MNTGRTTNVYDVEPVELPGARTLPVVASIDTDYGPLDIVHDPDVPAGTVEFHHPDGRVDRLVNVGR